MKKIANWIKNQDRSNLISYEILFVFLLAMVIVTPFTFSTITNEQDFPINNFTIKFIGIFNSTDTEIPKRFAALCQKSKKTIDIILSTQGVQFPQFFTQEIENAVKRGVKVRIYTDFPNITVPKGVQTRHFSNSSLPFYVNYGVFDRKDIIIPSRFYHVVDPIYNNSEVSYLVFILNHCYAAADLDDLFDMFWHYPSVVFRHDWANHYKEYNRHFSFVLSPTDVFPLGFANVTNSLRNVSQCIPEEVTYCFTPSIFPKNINTTQDAIYGAEASHLFEASPSFQCSYSLGISSQFIDYQYEAYMSLVPNLNSELLKCSVPFYGTIIGSKNHALFMPISVASSFTGRSASLGVYINQSSPMLTMKLKDAFDNKLHYHCKRVGFSYPD